MPKNKSFLRQQSRSYMQRRVDTLPIRQRFLIVCEGGKTEPNYFLRFRVPGLVVRVEGLGMNTKSVVQRAIELRKQDDYDQTWCVFDKDDFSDENFNEAIDLAERNAMGVAYSNPAFELWYLLHFDYIQTAILRSDYIRNLEERLGHKYEKNSQNIFDDLQSQQPRAMKHAANLLAQYNKSTPAKNDPSTTVHRLVEQLVMFSKPFGAS